MSHAGSGAIFRALPDAEGLDAKVDAEAPRRRVDVRCKEMERGWVGKLILRVSAYRRLGV